MEERTTSRRTVLQGARAALAALGAGAGLSGTAAASSPWETVESPTGNALYDVERTSAGVYAAGAGGTIVER